MSDGDQTTGRQRTAEECVEMAHVRHEIDRLDRALVALISERTRYIEAAARIKEDIDTVRLEWRIEEVVAKVLREAKVQDLPDAIAEPVWRTLIEQSIQHEFAVWKELRANGAQDLGKT